MRIMEKGKAKRLIGIALDLANDYADRYPVQRTEYIPDKEKVMLAKQNLPEEIYYALHLYVSSCLRADVGEKAHKRFAEFANKVYRLFVTEYTEENGKREMDEQISLLYREYYRDGNDDLFYVLVIWLLQYVNRCFK